MILASKGGAALGSAMRSGVDEAEGRMVETAAVLPPPGAAPRGMLSMSRANGVEPQPAGRPRSARSSPQGPSME